jgi:hypothetical protein
MEAMATSIWDRRVAVVSAAEAGGNDGLHEHAMQVFTAQPQKLVRTPR